MKDAQCGKAFEQNPHPSHIWFGSGGKSFCLGWPIMDAEGLREFSLSKAAAAPKELDCIEDVGAGIEVPSTLPVQYRQIAEDALFRFDIANREYGDSSKDETGLAGQWADLYRKIMKLKAPLWSGEKGRLVRESEVEILYDIIGHSLLALDMLRRGLEPGR